jgi:hypothetical protein
MGRRILLVEGKDDKHVVLNLRDIRRIPKNFDVVFPREQTGDESWGVEELLESIPAHLTTSNLERLAIIVDADDKGPEARWQSIRDRLSNAGYNEIPQKHSEDGTVFELSLRPRTPRSVRFAAWIMPDNRSNGMLEDFVTGLIHSDDDMLPFVDRFLSSIPKAQRRFVPAHQPKARIHSWLAVSGRPGRPMGQAIKADKHLDANHAPVQPFLNWIQEALVE